MIDQLKKDADEALQHQKHRAENHPCPHERKRAQTRVKIMEDGKKRMLENYNRVEDKKNK